MLDRQRSGGQGLRLIDGARTLLRACAELTKVGFQDFAGLTMWLSGYYNSSIRNTVIDLEQFARAAKTVKDYCQKNARTTVLSATERALGIKMPR